MGFCSVCGNWVDEGDICGHCGSSGGYDEEEEYEEDFEEEDEDDNHVDNYTYFYRKAKTSSIKGDHSSAIGFYKEVLRLSGPVENCEVMSYIAEEYETIEDYASAEDYWERCCAVKSYDSYKYTAGKGDFLYRRERYEEAIWAYEKVLQMLKDVKDKNFNLSMLEYYARTTHFLISSYNSLGKDNQKEKLHNELRHAIDRYIRAGQSWSAENESYYISQTAWKIYEDDRICDEALILIDAAIELHDDDNFYLRKAIFIKYQLEIKVIVKNIKPHDLDLINEALKILPGDCDSGPYLKVKGDILDLLGERVNAKVCRALAARDYEKVDEADKQLKKLTPYGTYINITGTQYYQHFAPFKPGTVVDLVKEPDNPHDPFAIRVEIKGETVGYVANSEYTLIRQVKSAADIKNFRFKQAEVLFILFNEWVIAKLI